MQLEYGGEDNQVVDLRGVTALMELSEELADLRARLERIEDTLAIMTLVASYGPFVDGDSRAAAGDLWTDAGVYDVDAGVFAGREQFVAMLGGDGHQQLLARGCAHQVSTPRIDIDGDRAVVRCYMQLVQHTEDGRFEILRMTANRWEMARTDAGWRVARRMNRVLDGKAQARDLLR